MYSDVKCGAVFLNVFMTGYFILFLLLCLAACLVSVRMAGQVGQEGNALTWDRREIFLFLVLMLLAFCIRAWHYGQVPAGMNQDGAMAAVDAKALADYGTDRFGMFMPVHFTAWGYGQMSVLMSYCMVPLIKLFGLSAVTARLPVLLASLAGLAALYGIGRRLLGKTGAAGMLLFATCNPWHFMQSRWALDCNMFPHMFLLGFYFLLRGVQDGKKRFAYLSMFFFALCMYSYGIAFYTVPPFLLIMGLYLPLRKLLRWRDVLICMGIYFGIAWPICLVMMINSFGWETIRTPFCTIPYFPHSMRSSDLLFFSRDKLGQLRKNAASLLQVYLRGDKLPWNTISGYGAVTVCFLPAALTGLVLCILRWWREKEAGKRAGYLAVLLYFLIANLSGLITAMVNVNRINILFYAVLILTGFGIHFIFQNLKKFSWAVIVAYAVLSVFFLHTYFTDHAKALSNYYFQDFLEAVSFAGEKVPHAKLCITPVVRENDMAANTAEILTLFALEVDAEFFQGVKLDSDGLSYAEKYQYRQIRDAGEIRPDTVYVITNLEAQQEFWGEYMMFRMKGYCVVFPGAKILQI